MTHEEGPRFNYYWETKEISKEDYEGVLRHLNMLKQSSQDLELLPRTSADAPYQIRVRRRKLRLKTK